MARDLTDRQIDLARHALGLDGRHSQSYRNRFVAGFDHADYADWLQMVNGGFATRRGGARLPFGGDDLFYLTVAGASRALRRGERLDPEDFPTPTASGSAGE